MLTQIYLNHSEIVQNILNVCTSYAMIGFIIYYRPFKDNLTQLSNFVCEICYSCIFTNLMIYSLGENIISENTYHSIAIFSVFGCIGIQFCISLYQFIVGLKKLYLTFLESRNLSILYHHNLNAFKRNGIMVKD